MTITNMTTIHSPDSTVEQMWSAWSTHLRRQHLSPSTIRSRRQMINGLVPYLEVRHNADPWKPTTEQLELWLDEKQCGAATRAFWVSHLNALYSWIAASDGITNPAQHLIRPKVTKGIPRPISELDLQTALDELDPKIRLWVVLGAFPGLRCKEIAGLHRRDISTGRTRPG